ncbi:TM2 domain-containing membrane protein YozV [Micrococcales bacterium KH10]|nr:TM2 domain-containing membrane protein YozV [Micrococcales bacterium KH10]
MSTPTDPTDPYQQGAPGTEGPNPSFGQQAPSGSPYQESSPYQQPAGGYQQPGPGYGQQTPPQAGYGNQPYGVPAAHPEAKSRLAAGLLGILLGGLGIHRFYLGYTGIGILQIVVTLVTFGAGAIWGLVEGILYLTDKTGNYSRDARGIPLAG